MAYTLLLASALTVGEVCIDNKLKLHDHDPIAVNKHTVQEGVFKIEIQCERYNYELDLNQESQNFCDLLTGGDGLIKNRNAIRVNQEVLYYDGSKYDVNGSLTVQSKYICFENETSMKEVF